MKYLVLDTVVFLHYKDFEQTDWKSLVGDDVTICLAQFVLGEIDKHKDQSRGKIQKRAKKVSSRFSEILLQGKPSRVDVEVMDNPPATAFNDAQYHKDINDDWIILSALYSPHSDTDIIIVSGDNGILLKAKNHGLGFLLMPDTFLLAEEPSDEEKEIRQLQQQLAKYERRRPKPSIEFEGGGDYLKIKRLETGSIEGLVQERLDELKKRWPEKTIEDGQESILGYVYNTLTPEQVTHYNISRNKFIAQYEKKIKLEVEREDLDRRMKKVSIIVSNDGTASTGKMNIFVEIPKGVKLYERDSKKKVEYDEPTTPNYYPSLPSSISIANPIYGFYKPSVEMWDIDDYIKEKELKEVSEPLTHNLQHLVFSFFVDCATCPNFKMRWYIADAALPDPVEGELNVSFDEE